ncbi:NAD(P)/FAD-dependent oxidoreductase [Streptomyces lincolnensis]|uniref:NAD(P)/FAD-dependent oxidoreductase n=1 Tax=Streptomyces lincolnensis TaxID=1915 RepID=UPI0037D06762
MTTHRVAVVGAGIAGTLLTWRLAGAPRHIAVDFFTGPPPGTHGPGGGRVEGSGPPDATAASGGLVRGYETDPEQCLSAAMSLAELRADRRLRDWADYRETGSLYLHARPADPRAFAERLHTVETCLPGSLRALPARDLPPDNPLRRRPGGGDDDAIAVLERHAGFISPGRLRHAVLADLAGKAPYVRVHREPIRALLPGPEPALVLSGGSGGPHRELRYDTVVLATGAWTPHLLTSSGLDTGQLRTKVIQYTLFSGRVPRLPAFVDDTSGLYGRPAADGSWLLGLPGNRWDVQPRDIRPAPDLADRVQEVATGLLGAVLGDGHSVAAADCYHPSPGLALRPIAGTDAVATFTGSSGGAAKTALAASRTAAAALIGGLGVVGSGFSGRSGPA